jgi:hypothetical protein
LATGAFRFLPNTGRFLMLRYLNQAGSGVFRIVMLENLAVG